jgi:hypothetical protein
VADVEAGDDAMTGTLTLDDLRRAMRMLDEPDEFRAWVLYRHELKVLGYEGWKKARPGNRLMWNGQPVIVGGRRIPRRSR